jgi:putative phage-type endonuclease
MMMHPSVEALLTRQQWAQRTPEWYEVRRSLLTASDAAAALGIKPFASYAGCPKADLLKKKLDNLPFSNIYTQHGQKYEDEARDLMAEQLGETVLDFGLLVHPTETWLAASPDGVTTSGKLVEIKCPLRRKIIPGHVPEHYLPQVQVQMFVCGIDSTLFVQYKPAPDKFMDITVVERDPAWIERNLPALRSFYDEYMAARQTHVPSPPPPPPTCAIDDNLYE